MSETIDASEVAKHNTKDSCWIILYGNVYDVTEFLPNHPGGANVIIKLSGKDATEEYDPIHPPGTLEENLPKSALIGPINPKTLSEPTKAARDVGPEPSDSMLVPMASLLNLDEIEEIAKSKMSKKGWAYYWSAADDLYSKYYNNKVYRNILLRPRVFVDCTKCDQSTTFLGHKLGMPLYVSPAAMARLAHPDGEWGIAQACKSFGAMQIISNNASMTPEQIVKDASPDQVFGWQLYVQTEAKKSEDFLARINKIDAIKFICLTLDAPVPGKRELDEKGKYIVENHDAAIKGAGGNKLKEGGGIGQSLFMGTSPSLTWKTTLPWLKAQTNKPVILKGLQTHEDAFIAAQYAPQVRAIVLSNHGGRAADTSPPALHTLLEIRKYCPQVFDKVEVVVDGGIRRGTDIVKALALGARAVGIGRGALYGLAAGGIEGVERVFEILRDETATAMRLLGAERIDDLGPQHVNARTVERDIYDGPVNISATAAMVSQIKSNL